MNTTLLFSFFFLFIFVFSFSFLILVYTFYSFLFPSFFVFLFPLLLRFSSFLFSLFSFLFCLLILFSFLFIFYLRVLFNYFSYSLSFPFLFHLFFSPPTQKKPYPEKKRSFRRKIKNRPAFCDFGICVPQTPNSQIFKTHKTFDLHDLHRLHFYTYICIYIICINKFKVQKSGSPSTTTTHHPNKIKISGVEIEILIKYKRIKWTPSGKASLLSSQGDKQTNKTNKQTTKQTNKHQNKRTK